MSALIICLRVLSVLLSPPILVLSWRGFIAFGRGRQSMANTIHSVGLLAAVSALSFQVLILVGITSPSPDSVPLLMSLVFSTAVLATCLLKASRMQCHRVGELEMVEGHIDVAMAIVDLDRLSPLEAAELAARCRHRVAALMIRGAGV